MYVYQLATSLMGESLGNIEIMLNSTASVKSNMNSGRYLFTITPDLHAKASLDKLGHDSITYGHYKHAIRGYLINRYPFGSIINYINHKRRMQFIAEREAAKKLAEQNNKP